MKRITMRKTMAALLLTMLMATSASAVVAVPGPWKFGVMSDTQWIGTDDGKNPGTCSVDIIKALNQQFIGKGVQFVVQVGDLVDTTGSSNPSIHNTEDVRAVFAQELFNATPQIGFFPLRGNHDSQPLAGTEFLHIYPQSLNGSMNSTPADAFTVPNADALAQPFPIPSGSPFTMGTNFSTPAATATGGLNWSGLTYSFDYNNARFVLLDQFSAPNAGANQNPAPNAIDLQQPWIDAVLSGKTTGNHAFVFSHKGLITENHVDTLFGADPSKDPAGQNAFINSLYNNGVRYYMQGHDHMHDRSLVSVTTGTPTDGVSAKVQNLLLASDSSKFYTPASTSNDDTYDVPAFGHKRQAQISQELHTVGYYIFTVDGPRVTGEYYSAPLSNVAPAGCSGGNCEWLIPTTPALNFVKVETFGYSLNGKEFLVAQGTPYTSVNDTYAGTTARILSGTNESTVKDFSNRALIKTVDTGWTDKGSDTISNVLSLWGMADLYAPKTDTYTLSVSYDPSLVVNANTLVLSSKDANGNWVNAADQNVGGRKRFILGPWNSAYPLGTYGVDSAAHTAWAVINTTGSGQFAVVQK